MALRPPGSEEQAERMPEPGSEPTTPDAPAAPVAPGGDGSTTRTGSFDQPDTATGRPPGGGPSESWSATRPSGPRKGKPQKGRLSFLRELPALIVLAFVLALLIKTFLVQAFYIPSASMVPTLKVGDRVLVNKFAYRFHPPGRGDVVVFSNPHPGPQPHRNPVSAFFHWVVEGLGISTPANEDFIKRVIGLPGDTVEIRHGVVYVNGNKLSEPYLNRSPRDTRSFQPVQVKPDHLFVMGDNRIDSNDSRFPELGQIPIDKVVGRAFVIIWPPSHFGGIKDGLREA